MTVGEGSRSRSWRYVIRSGSLSNDRSMYSLIISWEEGEEGGRGRREGGRGGREGERGGGGGRERERG